MSIPRAERDEILETAERRAATMAEDAAQIAVKSLVWEQKRKAAGMARRAAMIGAGVVILGGLAWAQFGAKRYTPRPETRATGKCADGTWTYAYNRQGACSGHGGVKVFYK